MKTRIVSAVILLPLVCYVVLVGGSLMVGVLNLSAILGFREFYHATKVNEKSYLWAVSIFSVVVFFLYSSDNMEFFFAANIVLLLFMLIVYAVKFPKIQLTDMAYMVYGVFYIIFLILTIAYVRDSHFYGNWMVWLIFIIAFASDSGAYFIGVNFGKRKLVPQLSPNKTIEGAYGGLLGGALGAGLFGVVMLLAGPFTSVVQVLIMVVVGVVGSVISQLGDLVGSAMKRQTGIKDFGNTIPGHGGILDRLDSILVTAAYIYLIQSLLIALKLGLI